jgi:N-acetylglucosaminyl-diphospho-decaprenol L-rhamnosyltransferase
MRQFWFISSMHSIMDSVGVCVRPVMINNGPQTETSLTDMLPARAEIVAAPTNVGYAGGANLGLKHGQRNFPGCSLAVIGSHDLHVNRHALREIVLAAEAHPKLGVVGPPLVGRSSPLGGDGVTFELGTCHLTQLAVWSTGTGCPGHAC